ncbi:hypothetical protein AB1K62_14400 [Parasphingorhabdus sp. JC815]|uniref:hypothetical protein n=1 Tax=Parasphingorhabdus sp. JC815 TaxID=3232140 RepID=UPI00345A5783
MALKTVIESTEGLDEALIPFYTEKDGKFVLQIEGVDAHPDVANLKSAYERVKTDRETARQERDQYKAKADGLPEDFDPEKWAKLKDGKADEAALVSLRQELEAERDDWKGKFEKSQETARKNALDRDLTDALTAAGVVNPAFTKAARNMLADGVQIGSDGKPFIDTDMGPLALADHVKRWAAGEGKDFVTAPKGGGAKGGDGSKPTNNPLMDKVPQLAELPEK